MTNKDEKRDFNKEAAEWDKHQRRVDMANAISKVLLADLPITKDTTVMDFGAGTGLVSMNLIESAGQVISVDDSDGMLDMLRKKLEDKGVTNCSTMNWDIESDVNVYVEPDVIVSAMTMHHLKNIEAALVKFYDTLQPNGWIGIADLVAEEGDFHSDSTGIHHHGFVPEELKTLCEKIGFKNLSYKTVHHIQKETKNGELKAFPVFLIIGQK